MTPDKIYRDYIEDAGYATAGDNVQFAVVADDSEKVVRLVFQGSCQEIDWWHNFDFPVRPYRNQENVLWVHRGWAKAWKSCNDVVMDSLIKSVNEHPGYTLQITGHSYGGALAVLAVEDYFFRTRTKVDELMTFGCPKPLFGEKSREYVYNQCVLSVKQYSHVNDCVPLLPPFPGYCRLTTDKVGTGFSVFKLFDPMTYHLIYGEKDLYNEK